jgi:mannose-6-phosphate isomerase-like protein (cupin superfamily)
MSVDLIDRGRAAEESEAMRRARKARIAQSPPPQFIRLRAELLAEGRSNALLADTGNMEVRLKVYASGGENGLHNHTNEDHMHVVLSGSACFYGPRGEEKHCGPYEGIVLPAGCFYRFHATGEEPLVLLRVSCKLPGEPYGRFNVYGEKLPSDSKANGATGHSVGTGKFWGAGD